MRGQGLHQGAVVVLSSALVLLGAAQVVRAAVTGAGPVAYLLGVLLLGAGGARLYLWWRGRGRGGSGEG